MCGVLAVIFTLPTSATPASALLGYAGDNFQHAWFLWEFAHAVVKLHNPFYTNLVYYPSRVNLAWSTIDPLAGLLALPISLTLGPVVAYNVTLVMLLALAAFSGRLLCLRVCGDEAAALVGGVCFGFSPFFLAHALGHLSLVTAFPIPLYFIALDRLAVAERPGWREGLLLGGALLLTALGHYNYTVICILATVVVMAVELGLSASSLRRMSKALALAAATFLAAFSPLLAMLLGNAADRPRPRGLEHVEQYSADVLGFLIPSWNHIALGRFARGMDPSLFVAGFEGTVYVGLVILALAALGVWKAQAAARRWVGLAVTLGLVFYALSLGPALRVMGRATKIPGPAALLYHAPGMSFLSAPARFAVITALSAAILASLGARFLLERLRNRLPGRAPIAVGALWGVLLIDLLTIPFPASSTADPAWLGDRAAPPVACVLPAPLQHGTVVTFPLIRWPYSMKSTWMQVSDQGRYKLVDGYLSYTPDRIWRDYDNNALLRSLLSIEGELDAPVSAAADRQAVGEALRSVNAGALVVFDSPEHDAAVAYLETVLEQRGERAGSCTVFAAPR